MRRPQARVRRTRRGDFQLRLPAPEREALRGLPAMLRGLLQEGDPSIRRLFPPAYPDDPAREREYEEMVRDDLLAERLTSLEIMESTIDADRLGEDQVVAWLGALNDLRLVFGTRLDAAEDQDPADLGEDDPRAPALVLYHYLGWLEEQVVEALTAALPPSPRGQEGIGALRVLVGLLVALILGAGVYASLRLQARQAAAGGTPAPSAGGGVSPSPSPPYVPDPTAPPGFALPGKVVSTVLSAWAGGRPRGAAVAAAADAVAQLFTVRGAGWRSRGCEVARPAATCSLAREGVTGRIALRLLTNRSGRFYLAAVSVPPLPRAIPQPLAPSALRGPAWGAYLAVGRAGTSETVAALDELAALGLGLESGLVSEAPITCGSGAAEALGVPADYAAVVVFFQTKSEAERFGTALPFPPEDVLKVTVTCS